jgi:hypothetical protein
MGKRARWSLLACVIVVATVAAFGGVSGAAKPGGGGGGGGACKGKNCPPAAFTGKCVVWLHGQGADGQATQTASNGVRYVYPRGNDRNPNGSGYRWLYFGEDRYAEAVGVVQRAIGGAGCSTVVIDGFSNGGAFAGKLVCRGATFDGATVAGYVIDDPVTDGNVLGCNRGSTNVSMYWTGALAYADGTNPPWDCAANAWTCETPTLIGSDAYAQALGTPRLQSPNRRHTPYTWPPEVLTWLGV